MTEAPFESNDEFLERAGLDRVSRRIHPTDEMLAAIRGYYERPESHRFVYFNSGHAALRSIEHFAAQSGKPLTDRERVLDFACGCGRLTRFLVDAIGPERIWASDIDSIGVDFVRNEFGVHGFYSCTEPDELTMPEQFDLIFVGSLFTHLPEAMFGRWLAKLYESLTPDGLLIFTTHGFEAFPSLEQPESGFAFYRQSETDRLDLAEYGSTYVTHEFVRATAERVGVGSLNAWKRELWQMHDVWVARANAEPSLDACPPSPWVHGGFTKVYMAGADHAWIGGYAKYPESLGGITDVRIHIDGVDRAGVVFGDTEPVDNWIQRDWYIEGDVSWLDSGPHLVSAVAVDASGTRHCFGVEVLCKP